MFCHKCGIEAKNDAVFCHKCGVNFSENFSASELPAYMTSMQRETNISQIKQVLAKSIHKITKNRYFLLSLRYCGFIVLLFLFVVGKNINQELDGGALGSFVYLIPVFYGFFWLDKSTRSK